MSTSRAWALHLAPKFWDGLEMELQREIGIAAVRALISVDPAFSIAPTGGLLQLMARYPGLEQQIKELTQEVTRLWGVPVPEGAPTPFGVPTPAEGEIQMPERLTRPVQGTLAEWEEVSFTPGKPFEPKLPYQVRVTEELQNLADGGTDKLLLMLPFQFTTAELVAIELFPLWFMSRNPGTNVLLSGRNSWHATFNSSLEATLERHEEFLGMHRIPSGQMKRMLMSNFSALRQESMSVGMAGRLYDLIVVNQPADIMAMSSKAARDQVWLAFQTNVLNSRAIGGKVVVLGQPAHQDDLISRLQHDPTWRVVAMPLTAEADDPLGRAVGESLIPGFTEEQAISSAHSWRHLQQRQAQLQLKPFLID